MAQNIAVAVNFLALAERFDSCMVKKISLLDSCREKRIEESPNASKKTVSFGDYNSSIFSHPDFTVGTGIAPVRLP